MVALDAPPVRRQDRKLMWLVAAAVVVPLVAGAVLVAVGPWHPFLDSAVHEMRIADVGTSSTPLLGPSATVDGIQGRANHPGPLAFYLLAVPYLLSGDRSKAVLFGAIAINTAAVVGSLWVARRRGGMPLVALTGVVVALLLRGLGLGTLIDEWNPWLALLPFTFLLLLVWSVVCEDLALLPLTAFVWSFVVQSHLGLAYYGVVLFVWAGVGGALAGRRLWRATGEADRPALRRRYLRWVGLTLLVGSACWLPPLIQQVTSDAGNLTRLRELSSTPQSSPAIGLGRALQVVSSEVGGLPPWAAGAETGTDVTTEGWAAALVLLAVPVGALVAAVVVSWRRRRHDTLRLQATVALVLFTALPTTAAVTGAVFIHYVRALWPIGAVLWLSVLWTAWQEAVARPAWAEPLRRTIVPASVAVIAVIGLGTIVARPDPVTPNGLAQGIAAVAEDAAPTVANAVFPNTVLLEDDGTLDGAIVSSALQLQLEKRGVSTLVWASPENQATFGAERTRGAAAGRVLVTTNIHVDEPLPAGFHQVYRGVVEGRAVRVAVNT